MTPLWIVLAYIGALVVVILAAITADVITELHRNRRGGGRS